MRIKYEDMLKEFQRVLIKKGFDEDDAYRSAKLYTENGLDGVYSHGVNRFPRTMEQIDKGYIDVKAKSVLLDSHGSLERWDGQMGMGNLNAQFSMDRAIELAKESGIGLVAIRNTNHWMRGGAYGWQAADEGCIGICWTNTTANMPPWGGKDARIGNNPFIISIPRGNKRHVVLDMAMSQFSYGKIEEYKLADRELPVPGGYDKDGRLTSQPGDIEETGRVLPIGFWKGAGLSIVLDLVAALLSGGSSTSTIPSGFVEERGISQVFIAIDPSKFNSIDISDEIIDGVLAYIKSSTRVEESRDIMYPGQGSIKTREENLEKGIPVNEEIWNTIKSM